MPGGRAAERAGDRRESTQVDANASMDRRRHKTLGCNYEQNVLALPRKDRPTATREDATGEDRLEM